MSRTPIPTPSVRLSGAVRFVFLYAALGVVAGTGWGLACFILDGGLKAGLHHSLVLALREETARLGVAGALLGALFGFGGLFLGRSAPALRRFFSLAALGSLLRRKSLGPWPYLTIMTLCLAVAGLSFLLPLRTKTWLTGCVAAAFVFCALTFVSRLAALRFSDPAGPGLRALLGAFYGMLAYLALAGHALWHGVYNAEGKFRQMLVRHDLLSAVIVALVCAGVVFLLLYLHTRRAVALERAGKGGAPAGLLSLLLVLAGVLLFLIPLFDIRVVSPRYEAARPKNVILIGLDTLRNDHTSILAPSGEEKRDLTPHLRRLAARGTVFEAAISQAPWTLPAFSSIHTGQYPHDHGAVSIYSELDGRHTTVAEILREAGFATGAVVSHLFVDSARGFDQGFGSFNEENSLGHWAITSEAVTDRAIDFLDEAGEENFFLFLHYFDPHNTYRDHAGWSWADSYSGWLSETTQDIQLLRKERQALDAADTRYLVDLYDEEIAYTDQQVGRLLNELRSRGLDEDTAIIVVSDHGEEFMERGWLGHSATLFDELIHVPLFVVLPGEEQVARVAEPVETRDVFSTILDIVGIAGEDAGAPPSLLPRTRPGAPVPEERPVFSAVGFPDYYYTPHEERTKIVAMRRGDMKVIRDLSRRRRYLFDLAADPGEQRNLCQERPEKAQELFEELDAWIQKVEDIENRPPGVRAAGGSRNEEMRRALDGLGY